VKIKGYDHFTREGCILFDDETKLREEKREEEKEEMVEKIEIKEENPVPTENGAKPANSQYCPHCNSILKSKKKKRNKSS
jgi:hypothetical protein